MTYDFGIIGAGAAGLFASYYLKSRGAKVAIFERSKSFPSGASSAAGAFISPMMGKPNPIKNTLNRAFKHSIDLYKENLPSTFLQSGILKIDKSEEDMDKNITLLKYCEDIKIKRVENLAGMNIKNSPYGGYLFCEAGVVEVEKVANMLVEGCDLFLGTSGTFEKKSGTFEIEGKKVDKLIIATGIDTDLIDEEYLKIRPIWGERIEISADNLPEISISKDVSISANRAGKAAIGATHLRWKREGVASKESVEYLIKSAQEIYDLKNIEVVKTFCGARAGSSDYLPIVGKIVDGFKTLDRFPMLKNGTKIDSSRFIYKENIYIFNGLGARGFVYAPYCAKLLSDFLVEGKDIEKGLDTTRLFSRWAKRGEKNPSTF